jgi:hypothetical protein
MTKYIDSEGTFEVPEGSTLRREQAIRYLTATGMPRETAERYVGTGKTESFVTANSIDSLFMGVTRDEAEIERFGYVIPRIPPTYFHVLWRASPRTGARSLVANVRDLLGYALDTYDVLLLDHRWRSYCSFVTNVFAEDDSTTVERHIQPLFEKLMRMKR